MNEEQIYNAAKEWAAEHLDAIRGRQYMDDIAKVFSAGAHSRDEEVERLEERIKVLDMNLVEQQLENQQLRNDNKDLEQALACAEDVVDAQKKELDQLRNPWISVEDRLPDIGQKVITITNKGKLLLVARTTQPPHKEEGGWRWEHYVGKVTHWMPIPELKKGE